MRVKFPKDTERMVWTKHSRGKMQQYQLSERRLKRVLRNPSRVEKGIAPHTLAVMQTAGTKKHPTEIWLMYQTLEKRKKKKLRIISAWRYPGVSPKGELPPIPKDTLAELEKIIQAY
jgi:hypothetical protein